MSAQLNRDRDIVDVASEPCGKAARSAPGLEPPHSARGSASVLLLVRLADCSALAAAQAAPVLQRGKDSSRDAAASSMHVLERQCEPIGFCGQDQRSTVVQTVNQARQGACRPRSSQIIITATPSRWNILRSCGIL